MPNDTFNAWWLKFRATGDICPVRLGCTREDIRALLGEPDDVGCFSRKHKVPQIWKYGTLEFHFGPKSNDLLTLIYSDSEDGIVDVSIPRRVESTDR